MTRPSRHRAGSPPGEQERREQERREQERTVPRASVLDTIRRGGVAGVGEARALPASCVPASSVPAASLPAASLPPPGLWSTFGPLAPYLMRDGVTDLFITGDGSLWSDGGPAGLYRIPEWRADEHRTRRLAVELIARGGRHIDEATPFVDVRLHDGVRVHAVLPPVSTGGTLLSIRIPGRTTLRLSDLVGLGTMTPAQRQRLEEAVASRTNLLVTGASGAGKTTLLAAMLAHAPPDERIVLIEDVAELRIAHPHVVGLQARQANIEGRGGVGLRRLVREALRMRPDRLVLGECRGEEVVDLLSALNTGHDGGAGTLHANTLDDVPARLEALGALADLSDRALARQAVSAIGLVVHMERTDAGRRVAGFGRLVTGADGRVAIVRVDGDDAPDAVAVPAADASGEAGAGEAGAGEADPGEADAAEADPAEADPASADPGEEVGHERGWG